MGTLKVKIKARKYKRCLMISKGPILLLVDVKLANIRFHHSLLIYSQHIKHSSLICIS